MKERIVQTYGRCDNTQRHEAHVFEWDEYEHHISLWDCPGVYVDCVNCDDRKCMDCVLRYMHDRCEDDCPMCCGGEK